jgi:hypothetical protein
MTQEKKLGYALQQLQDDLLMWGIDNHLGDKSPLGTYIRLSEKGATNLVALVNTLKSEIRRLSLTAGELYVEGGE